jgi:hypothetical protein
MELKVLIGAAALAAACLAGWRLGAGHVQQEWDAAERGRATLAAQQRRLMNEQAAAREAERLAGRAQLEKALDGLDNVLRTPIRCPASGELEFGDVPVPAGVFDRLRRAGELPPGD